jgi:hypothetical protein
MGHEGCEQIPLHECPNPEFLQIIYLDMLAFMHLIPIEA